MLLVATGLFTAAACIAGFGQGNVVLALALGGIAAFIGAGLAGKGELKVPHG